MMSTAIEKSWTTALSPWWSISTHHHWLGFLTDAPIISCFPLALNYFICLVLHCHCLVEKIKSFLRPLEDSSGKPGGSQLWQDLGRFQNPPSCQFPSNSSLEDREQMNREAWDSSVPCVLGQVRHRVRLWYTFKPSFPKVCTHIYR